MISLKKIQWVKGSTEGKVEESIVAILKQIRNHPNCPFIYKIYSNNKEVD